MEDWTEVQSRVFSRWVNWVLKEKGKDIEIKQLADLSDSYAFATFCEAVTGLRARAINRRPRLRLQHFENVAIGMELLKEAGVRIMSVGPEDIISFNLRIVLGLMWSTFLSAEWRDRSGSLKETLLGWAKSLTGSHIFSFRQADGPLLWSLCQAMAPYSPALSPKEEGEGQEDVASKALTFATEQLGIPRLLEPPDVARDELTSLMYLRFLHKYWLAHRILSLGEWCWLSILKAGLDTSSVPADLKSHYDIWFLLNQEDLPQAVQLPSSS